MKKVILKNIILITMTLIIIIIPRSTYAVSNRLMGDVSGDGKIDVEDVLNILRHISATNTGKNKEWILKDNNFKVANVVQETGKNKEEKLDVLDMLRILRYITAKNDKNIEEKHKDWVELGELVVEPIPSTPMPSTSTPSTQTPSTPTPSTPAPSTPTPSTPAPTTQTPIITTPKTPTPTTIAVKSIKFEKAPKTITVKNKSTVKATVSPTNATNKKITYSSSNKNVVTIDSTTGKITAKKVGTAKITAKSGNKSKSYTITVVNPVTKVTIKGLKTPFILEKGETLNLTSTISPKGATNTTNANTAKAKFTSSKTKVATVTSAGKIKGIAKGTTTITVTAGEKKATCKVKVIESDFSFKNVPETLRVNDTLQLKKYISYTPKETTQKIKEWKSSDESVLSINNKTGKVKANKTGTAKITATLENGKKKSYKIRVLTNVSSSTSIGPGGGRYDGTITLNGRTFKLYKQGLNRYMPYFNSSGSIIANGCGPTAVTIILSGYNFEGDTYDFVGFAFTNSSISNFTDRIKSLQASNKLDKNIKTKGHYQSGRTKEQIAKDLRTALENGHELAVHVVDSHIPNIYNDASIMADRRNYSSSSSHWVSILGYDPNTEKVFCGNPGGTGHGWFSFSSLVNAVGSTPEEWLEIYK